MGAPARPSHHWTSAPEPHAVRHKLMMQRYGPQVRPLGRGTLAETGPAVCAGVSL